MFASGKDGGWRGGKWNINASGCMQRGTRTKHEQMSLSLCVCVCVCVCVNSLGACVCVDASHYLPRTPPRPECSLSSSLLECFGRTSCLSRVALFKPARCFAFFGSHSGDDDRRLCKSEDVHVVSTTIQRKPTKESQVRMTQPYVHPSTLVNGRSWGGHHCSPQTQR